MKHRLSLAPLPHLLRYRFEEAPGGREVGYRELEQGELGERRGSHQVVACGDCVGEDPCSVCACLLLESELGAGDEPCEHSVCLALREPHLSVELFHLDSVSLHGLKVAAAPGEAAEVQQYTQPPG